MNSALFPTNPSWALWVEIEAVNALTPDYYGGNMDCVDTSPGNEVWFPVLVEGAHFFTGDAHASQGDGELTGVALEIPAKMTVTFDLKKGYSIGWPRIVSDDFIMVAGSGRPLDAAARIAWVELIDWMVADYGLDRMKAYHLLGQVGQMRLGQYGGSEVYHGREVSPAILTVTRSRFARLDGKRVG